ncbi:MAG TPA: helix-turn-helix transcriptional regulator [Thermoanaerobaculia bacterium]|nr:helix-turn-helix transcriptional regulator [Thermoanaerobaculia bacterium]
MASPHKLFADLGAVAKRLREEQGLTFGELEQRSGVSDSTIRRIEEGGTVKSDRLDKVFAALGVEDWLEMVGHQARVLRERRQTGAPYARHVAEGPAELGTDSPPLHVRVRLGDREALLTLTLADLETFRREQPDLPWPGRGE